MNNLASGYRELGELDKAITLYEETVGLMKSKLGEDHPTTLMCVNSLAATYWESGDLSKSIPLFEETLSLREKKIGRKDRGTQLIIANLGVNYIQSGRVEEGVPLLEEAHNNIGQNKNYSWIGDRLLQAYAAANSKKMCSEFAKERELYWRKTEPADSTRLAARLASIAQQLLKVEDFEFARALLDEILVIRQREMPDSWLTFSATSMLGDALRGMNEFHESEKQLLVANKAIDKEKRLYSGNRSPQNDREFIEAIDRSL